MKSALFPSMQGHQRTGFFDDRVSQRGGYRKQYAAATFVVMSEAGDDAIAVCGRTDPRALRRNAAPITDASRACAPERDTKGQNLFCCLSPCRRGGRS